MKVLCIGEVMRDITLRLDEAKILKDGNVPYLSFEYGQKLQVQKTFQSTGGSAANVAVGLSRLGIDTALTATLGNDLVASEMVDDLHKERLDTGFIHRSDNFQTKLAVILSAGEGDRTILVYHGSANFSEELLDAGVLRRFDFIYLGPLPESSEGLINKVVCAVKERNLGLIVNPGFNQLKLGLETNKEIIRNSLLYVLNKEEAEKLLEKNNPENDTKKLVQEISSIGAKNVVITLGKKGSLSFDGEKMIEAGIYPVKRVDATGAGDSFLAAIAASLLFGKSLKEGVRFGTINSASVVSHYGAQTGLLHRGELEKLVREAKIEIKEI